MSGGPQNKIPLERAAGRSRGPGNMWGMFRPCAHVFNRPAPAGGDVQAAPALGVFIHAPRFLPFFYKKYDSRSSDLDCVQSFFFGYLF